MPIPSINFIGCGRLGKDLARILSERHLALIQNVYTTSLANSQAAISVIGQGKAIGAFQDFTPADLYFFCTPDDAIESCCQQLLAVHKPPVGSYFVHFSGSLTSNVLSAARSFDCFTSSLHPSKSFTKTISPSTALEGTLCAFEGDQESAVKIQELFAPLGAKIFPIDADKKTLYHIAAVFASNYLVTLTHCALDCYQKANIPEDSAKALALALMHNTLQNILSTTSTKEALTGPLARGDLHTIQNHLDVLETLSPHKALYALLGRTTLSFAVLEKPHREQFLELLE